MAGVTAAVILGASAIAAGGAVAAGAIASSGAKKAASAQKNAQQAQLQQQQQAAKDAQAEKDRAVARKEAAIADIPITTLSEQEGFGEFKKTLQERIAGRGLIDIDKTTAPFAAQRRAGLKQTGAAISSATSARGLGRSTIPVSRVGEASQAAERDIEQRVADLSVQNAKLQESAIGQFQNLVNQEATSAQRKAVFERGDEFSVANTIAGNAEAFKKDQFAIADTIAQNGASQAAWEIKQAEIWASAILGATKGAGESTQDIIDAIETKQQIPGRSAAQVAIAGSGQTGRDMFGNPISIAA